MLKNQGHQKAVFNANWKRLWSGFKNCCLPNVYYCDTSNPWQKGDSWKNNSWLRTYHLLALLLILVLIKIDLGDKN